MQIGWIDYSKDERNKIVAILNALGSHEALDELGIGSVRDAFSDMLFPGISVLQTRAKYFLLIPYMFNDACMKAQSGKLHCGSDVRKYISKCEDDIVYTLINRSGDDSIGIIGSRNYYQRKTVVTRPSAIYWNGLRTMEILAEPSFSIDNACNAMYRKGRLHAKTERKYETKEAGADDSDIMNDGYIVFNTISPKYNYLTDAKLSLTKEEADYLRNRIWHAEATKDSALAYFLKHPNLLMKYASFEDFDPDDFRGALVDKVRLAKAFADFIYGAHLLYNIIYADGCSCESDIINSIKDEFADYVKTYRSPNVEDIIVKTNAKYDTAKFIRDFDAAMSVGDITKAQQIVVAREQSVKRQRSKLLRPTDYQFAQPIHHFKLSYRYERANVILMDIINGLEADNG